MAQAQLDKEMNGMGKYFNTRLETNGLYAYHSKGCQIIDFGEAKQCPGQADILTAMKIEEININDIKGLQNMGRNKYMLYPKDPEVPIIKREDITVKGEKGLILQPSPIFRDIYGRRIDIFISGLPLEINNDELVKKFINKFKVNVINDKKATVWGFPNIFSGVRVITIKKEDTKKIPTFFYVMGFLLKSWYRGCEFERVCPRCKNIGHKARDCLNPILSQPNTYAGIVTGNKDERAEVQEVPDETEGKEEPPRPPRAEAEANSEKTPKTTEKWREILSPAINSLLIEEDLLKENPFHLIQEEEEEGEQEISGIIPITSTPMRIEETPREKREIRNLSDSSSEVTPIKKDLKKGEKGKRKTKGWWKVSNQRNPIRTTVKKNKEARNLTLTQNMSQVQSQKIKDVRKKWTKKRTKKRTRKDKKKWT